MVFHCWGPVPDEVEPVDEDEPKKRRGIIPTFISHQAPFWPRYWFQLTGYSWSAGLACHHYGAESDTKVNFLGPKRPAVSVDFHNRAWRRAREELKKAKELGS
jgi:hypothetical protein